MNGAGNRRATASTSASVLISASTTIFGFGVLVLANHPVLFSMGTTVLLGMSFAFVATLVLTPLCMDLLLFRNPPRGAPRWWHPLGTLWVILHLGGSQVFLYYVLRPDSENCFAAHRGRPVAPRHPLDGARRGERHAVRQTGVSEHHAAKPFPRRASSSAITSRPWT